MSSFDEGVVFDCDVIGVKSRLKAAMFDRNCGMGTLQKRTSITQQQLESAFESLEYGNPEAVRIISVAAEGTQVSPNWVMSGLGENPLSKIGRLIQIAWETLYRMQISHEKGKQFEAWLKGRFGAPDFSGANSERFRKNPPQSSESVSILYKEFEREMRKR